MFSIEVQNRIKQMNPWMLDPGQARDMIGRFLPEDYVPRKTEKLAVPPERAILIAGPRQAGKSTVVWRQLIDIAPDVLFLNMEDPLLRVACDQPLDLTQHLREDYSFIRALFIDEIQHLEEAGLFIKGLVDARLKVHLWVTGSSAFDLKSRTRESLAGRASRRRLLPFSLEELRQHAEAPNPVAERAVCDTIVSHQLIFGSYPAVYSYMKPDQKKMLLSDLVDALILRDASDLFRIRHVAAFRKLLTLLAMQIGNLLNVSELASLCNVDAGTVNTYIEILEESHIVRKVLPYAGGKRREITSAPKVFFVDNGIRNQLLNDFSGNLELRTDKGPLFENWAFSEILKALSFQDEIRFWRSKSGAEVDFVIEHAGRIHGLEVKASVLKQPAVSRSSWSFIEAYAPDSFAVLNMYLEESLGHDKGTVDFITPYTLGSWLQGVLS
jgi:uncharacterized protein